MHGSIFSRLFFKCKTMALKHPERVTDLIVQNGNTYDEGLKEFWDPIKAYWADHLDAHRKALNVLVAPETTKVQYTGASHVGARDVLPESACSLEGRVFELAVPRRIYSPRKRPRVGAVCGWLIRNQSAENIARFWFARRFPTAFPAELSGRAVEAPSRILPTVKCSVVGRYDCRLRKVGDDRLFEHRQVFVDGMADFTTMTSNRGSRSNAHCSSR
jgi:hypothetical protein